MLVSLVKTACGQVSAHFAWDERYARFTWAETLQRDLRAQEKRRLRRAIKKAKATTGKKARERQEMVEQLDAVRLSSPEDDIMWKGKERIHGLTEEASEAVVSRFLDIGSLQRRLYGRIEDLRRKVPAARKKSRDESDDDEEDLMMFQPPLEAYALASSLSSVLDWLSGELQEWSAAVPPDAALSSARQDLEVIHLLLSSLADMCACSMSRVPPFRFMTRPPAKDNHIGRVDTYAATVQTTQLLNLVHSHMHAVLASSAPPLVQGVWSYLLATTTRTWREQLATWVGWPCPLEAKQEDAVERQMLVEREKRQAKEEIWSEEMARCEPWPGAEVEWAWDERGEEDVGYILRPSRLPAMLPLHSAKDVLEAGRALRLLRRAAPPGHPLLISLDGRVGLEVVATSRSSSSQRGPIPVPSWTWSDVELKKSGVAVETRVRELQREIARWRRVRGQRSGGPPSSASDTNAISFPRYSAIPAHGTLTAGNVIEGGFQQHNHVSKPSSLPSALSKDLERAMLVFDALPGETLDDKEDGEKEIPQANTLLEHIAYALRTASASDGRSSHNISLLPPTSLGLASLTEASIIAPLLQWSRLINSSLISVFFRDLGLATYLETCRRFLLLGNRRFADRIAEVLFDVDWLDQDEEERGQEGEGVGLSKMLRKEPSWPPSGGSQLSSALNFVVLETVSELKTTDAVPSGGTTHDEETLSAEKLAIRDLDDRLSFAVVRPDKGSKANGNVAWRDRRSIEALDWLTLSFHPPPLIAPLLTPQTQESYRRLFNHLLKLMRVRHVLDMVFRKICSSRQSTAFGQGQEKAQRLILAFRFEAQHVMDLLQAHSSEVAVGQRWESFMARLNQLRREAEERDTEAFVDEGDAFEEEEREVDEDESIANDEEQDGDDEDPAATADEGAASARRRMEIKDVFSLARYHEWTLERMVSGCFLGSSKKRGGQRGGKIYEIIEEIMNLVLAFGDFVLTRATKEEAILEKEEEAQLEKLHKRFRSRVALLGKALEVVLEHSSSSSNAAAGSTSWRQKASAAEPDSLASLELQRQEEEAQRDLLELQRDSGGNLKGSETEAIRCLILGLSSIQTGSGRLKS